MTSADWRPDFDGQSLETSKLKGGYGLMLSPAEEVMDLLDRCLSAASLCVERGNDFEATESMKLEFREVAREVSEWRLEGLTKVGIFLQPMEKQLIRRHGPVVGRELYWQFVDVFWIQSWTDIPLEAKKLQRTTPHTMNWHWRSMAHRVLHGRLFIMEDCMNHLPLD